jgi:ABC-2 type transport system permease protein
MSDRGTWPGVGALILTQVRHQVRLFLRVPIGLFFTIALPLIMLVVFNAVFGDSTVASEAGEWPTRQFYIGALAAFTAVSATYTNLANTVPVRREEGILKRWRSTPLPVPVLILGQMLGALVVAILGALLLLIVGVLAYGLEVDVAALPNASLTFIVGVLSFAALGMAVSSAVSSADSAPAVANATILPLAFISNIFIPLEDPPRWLDLLGDIFPLKPFAESFQASFHPIDPATSPDLGALAVVALWGALGAVAAVRTFRFDPTPGATPSGRRRQRGRQRST